MPPSDELKRLRDATKTGERLAKLEVRMDTAEKGLETLTKDVKDEMSKVTTGLGQVQLTLGNLVNEEECLSRTSGIRDGLVSLEKKLTRPKKPLLERLRENAAAITVIGGLFISVLVGMYKFAVWGSDRLVSIVKKETASLKHDVAAVKEATRKTPPAPKLRHLPFPPPDTTLPTPRRSRHYNPLRHAAPSR